MGVGGSRYFVELFEDGTYRLLWNNQIGNLYKSTGVILDVPLLYDDEWDEDNGHYFDNAIEAMDDIYNQAMIEAYEAY